MPKTQQFLIYFPISTDTGTIISNKTERTVCAQRLHFSKFNTEFTTFDVQIIHKLHTNSECERCPFQRKIRNLLPENVAAVYCVENAEWIFAVCALCSLSFNPILYSRSLSLFLTSPRVVAVLHSHMGLIIFGLWWFFIPM